MISDTDCVVGQVILSSRTDVVPMCFALAAAVNANSTGSLSDIACYSCGGPARLKLCGCFC